MSTSPTKTRVQSKLPPSFRDEGPVIRSVVHDSGNEMPISPVIKPPEPLEVSELLSTGRTGFAAVQRLIVLVPNQDIDESELARRIWEVASPPRLAVLFLGLCRDTADEAQMRRHLVTLSALTREPRVKTETRLEFGTNWIRKVKATLNPGDIILCHAEQRTGPWHKPLNQALSTLGVPVWTLAGFYTPSNPSPLTEILFWTVSLAILIGFFFIQVRLVRLPKDWTHDVLLYISMFLEAGLLWVWHQLSG